LRRQELSSFFIVISHPLFFQGVPPFSKKAALFEKKAALFEKNERRFFQGAAPLIVKTIFFWKKTKKILQKFALFVKFCLSLHR